MVLPQTQTCYPPVGIVYNLMPLSLLSGLTVLLMDENSLPNCSLNHSPISLPIDGKRKFGFVFRVFHHLEACFSVVNFRLCSSE